MSSLWLSVSTQTEYLRDLAEVLLYFMLPPKDFQSKPLRFLMRVSHLDIISGMM